MPRTAFIAPRYADIPNCSGWRALTRVYAGDHRPHEARLKELLPRLRRYARGLVPSREAADALVEATLARAAGNSNAFGAERESRMRLFSVMHEVYIESAGAAAGQPSPGDTAIAQFDRAL